MSEEKTLDEIADEIVGNSDGSFSITMTDEYEALDGSQQAEVLDMVHEQIDACGSCGWNFYIDSLEPSIVFEEAVCWSCAETERADAEYEENNGECGRCGESNEFDAMNVIEGEYVCVNCESNEDED